MSKRPTAFFSIFSESIEAMKDDVEEMIDEENGLVDRREEGTEDRTALVASKMPDGLLAMGDSVFCKKTKFFNHFQDKLNLILTIAPLRFYL